MASPEFVQGIYSEVQASQWKDIAPDPKYEENTIKARMYLNLDDSEKYYIKPPPEK